MTTNELLAAPPAGAASTLSAAIPEAAAGLSAGGPIVIALDGSRPSDAALRVGALLAERDGAEAVILGVYEPLPAYDPAVVLRVGQESMERALMDEFTGAVEAQVRRAAREIPPWRTRFERGQPARTIARAATESGGRLIVLGLGRHGPLERALGRETALQVARLSEVPVLAVPPAGRSLPRRVLVAVDFSESSRRAAHAALALLGPKGALYLVHVMPRIAVAAVGPGDAWEAAYRREAAAMLAELERELGAPADVHVERVVLRGDAARQLLSFAERDEIELIATGSHGHTALARTIVGSVSTRLLRGAACAVLMMPPAAAVPRA